MRANLVAIPTIINPERVVELAKKYAKQKSATSVYIFDNGHEDISLIVEALVDEEKITVIPTHGMNLYAQWNWALQIAQALSFDTVTISNDDIDIDDHLIQKLEDGLFSDNDCWVTYPANKFQYNKIGFVVQTRGTKADGGMDGCCFMIKVDALYNGLPLIDEKFIWWGGDDDLAMNIEKLNKKQFRVLNAWVDHQNEGTVSSGDRFKHLHEKKKLDIQYLRTKWGIYR